MATDNQDKSINDLLAAGLTDQQIMQMAINARNQRADQIEQSTRPTLSVTVSATDVATFKTFAFRDKDDSDMVAVDRMCLLAKDAISSGDPNSALFALLRVWRAAWYQLPHLGAINGTGQ